MKIRCKCLCLVLLVQEVREPGYTLEYQEKGRPHSRDDSATFAFVSHDSYAVYTLFLTCSLCGKNHSSIFSTWDLCEINRAHIPRER